MRAALLTLGLFMAALAASAATDDEPAPTVGDVVKQWEADIQTLKLEVRAGLEKRLKEIHDKLVLSNEFARLRIAYEEAQAAYDNCLKGSKEVAAARKAEEEAAAAWSKAEAAAIASDPVVAQLKAQVAEARRAADAADVQRRVAEAAILQIRTKLSNSEEVNKLYQDMYKQSRALKELAAKDPKVAAAQKAYEAASKAYENAVTALPEYKRRSEKPEAYSAARHAMPEYKARNETSTAYEAACEAFAKTDPAARAAVAARDAAEKAYRKKLDELTTKSPEILAQTAKSKAAEAAAKAALARIPDIQKKHSAAVSVAAAKNPDAVKARQAYDAARKAGRDLQETKLGAAKRARDETYTALETKLKEKLDADPKVFQIQKEILAVEAKIKELQAQLDDIRKP